MLLQMTRFHSFYDSVVFQPHLFYPFTCCWTLSLLPYLDNHKQCCNEHWTCIFSNYCLFYFSFLDLYPGVELLGHIVVLYLVQSFFGGTRPTSLYNFPQWLQQYIPSKDMRVPFLHILVIFAILVLLMISILTGVWWYLTWISLMISSVSCACWPSALPLWKNVYFVLILSFNHVVWFCTAEPYTLSICVGYWPLIGHFIHRCFLSFSRYFYLLNDRLYCVKAFKCNEVPLVYFCFYFLHFRSQIQNTLQRFKERSACLL